MSNQAPHRVQRGETILFILEAYAQNSTKFGDVSAVASAAAAMRRVIGNSGEPDPAATRIDFSSSFEAATATTPPRWIFTYSASLSASLAKGVYAFNVALTMTDGSVRKLDHVLIVVEESAV